MKYCVLLVLFATNETLGDCDQWLRSMTYVDAAADMISRAKMNFPPRESCNNSQEQILDCSDLLRMGHRSSGVYTISPINRLMEKKTLDVYCDMETDGGGWTVIQRRGEFGNPIDYFYKDWKSYKDGFGDLEKEFWLGNDNIFALTNQKVYSARFDLGDIENNTAYAQYRTFYIDDESNKYTLHIANYSGDAGDSMIETHNNQKFTTKDQDNDNYINNCAQYCKGAWWYHWCQTANLNGLYLKGKDDYFSVVVRRNAMNWNSWKGPEESLSWTEIKIRPKKFG